MVICMTFKLTKRSILVFLYLTLGLTIFFPILKFENIFMNLMIKTVVFLFFTFVPGYLFLKILNFEERPLLYLFLFDGYKFIFTNDFRIFIKFHRSDSGV